MASSSINAWSNGAARKSSLIGSSTYAWWCHLKPCVGKARDGIIKLLCLIWWGCSQEQPHQLKHYSLTMPSQALLVQGFGWHSQTYLFKVMGLLARATPSSQTSTFGNAIRSLAQAGLGMASSNCNVWADGVALASSPIRSNITVWSYHPKPSLSLAWDGMDQTHMFEPMRLLLQAATSDQAYVFDPYHPKPWSRSAWDGLFKLCDKL